MNYRIGLIKFILTLIHNSFQFEVEDWLELFLTSDKIITNSTHIEKGLYNPSTITPYIHVLVYHISEFMEIHKQWGLKSFSCDQLRRKTISKCLDFFKILLKMVV